MASGESQKLGLVKAGGKSGARRATITQSTTKPIMRDQKTRLKIAGCSKRPRQIWRTKSVADIRALLPRYSAENRVGRPPGGSRGIQKRNAAPRAVGWSSMRPPWRATISQASARPSP
jgi:hypothetical protein